MPKYKFPEDRPPAEGTAESGENSTAGPAGSQSIDINKLRVNLFSRWGEESGKTEENTSDKGERSREVVVNYSTREMSPEYPMMDSSTAHIEYWKYQINK